MLRSVRFEIGSATRALYLLEPPFSLLTLANDYENWIGQFGFSRGLFSFYLARIDSGNTLKITLMVASFLVFCSVLGNNNTTCAIIRHLAGIYLIGRCL